MNVASPSNSSATSPNSFLTSTACSNRSLDTPYGGATRAELSWWTPTATSATNWRPAATCAVIRAHLPPTARQHEHGSTYRAASRWTTDFSSKSTLDKKNCRTFAVSNDNDLTRHRGNSLDIMPFSCWKRRTLSISKQEWYNGSLYSVSHYSVFAGFVLRPSTLECGLRFFFCPVYKFMLTKHVFYFSIYHCFIPNLGKFSF